MALLEERGADFHEHVSTRGVSRFWTLAPNVYVTCVRGHMDASHAVAFEVYSAERIRRSPDGLYVFHDWVEMTGYDSLCRKRMTEWSAARVHHYLEVHLAVRSKLVAMGVQVANIALRGMMRAYTDRLKIELELKRVLRTAVPSPSLVPPSRRPEQRNP